MELQEEKRNVSSVHIPSQHVANISFNLFFTASVGDAGEVAMEASSSYCGVGIDSGARIGGEENNKALSRWWEDGRKKCIVGGPQLPAVTWQKSVWLSI